LASVLFEVRPVAAGAHIYCGKVAFDVNVEIEDAAGNTVATMVVSWHAHRV
jgi:hypothetical protein